MNGETLLGQDYVEGLAGWTPFALSDESLGAIRAGIDARMAPLPPSDVTFTDYEVEGGDVIVRVHRSSHSTGTLPCIYSIHGGGYVLGDYTMDDARFAKFCPLLDCVGVSVEYRLAPEFAYPTPLEDCYAGLVWTHEHAEELGIDPTRIGIAGVSAGGGLAAALALLARDRGEPAIAFQLLECPMVDDRQVTTSSQLEGLAVWSRESNTYGWRSYLGDRYGTGAIPAYAAPARAEDLTGLPPALVCVGGADGFRDEDIEYAKRLGQAGVLTELHVYPGAPHGAQLAPDAAATLRWIRDVEDWLARHI